MKGLALCRAYFQQYGEPMLREKFPEAAGRIAAGLAGPGSECFGFDDEISRDHDWGPGFCLWLAEEDLRGIGGRLAFEYAALPGTFMGFGPRTASPGEEHRVGPFGTLDFFQLYTGLRCLPETAAQWLRMSEESLAVCTNGEVWTDPLGEFSRLRTALLSHFPEDVRLKKIASRCITIAQSGQYNYRRSTRRGQRLAARFSEVQFCRDVISLVFQLNRRYPPYFKWALPALEALPLLGAEIFVCLNDVLQAEAPPEKDRLMQECCERLAAELRRQGLSDSNSDFLLDHVSSIHERISDCDLRRTVQVVP